MPSKRIPRKGIQEFPIAFAQRPFCVSPAADFNLHFLHSSLVDEALALQLHLPIRNLQYQKFSLTEDKTVWSRLVGTIKATCQTISKGRLDKSFSFSAKVIRNLAEITGAEAVCDELLEEKLSSLPTSQFQKPGDKIKKWLKKCDPISPNQNPPPSQIIPPAYHYQSENPSSTWPATTATPFYSQCRCDWSEASAHGTICCNHRGPCQHCADNLADVATEVGNFPETILNDEGLPDNSQDSMDINLIDHSDSGSDVDWYEVNQFVDGNILFGTGIFEPHSGWTPQDPGDDVHVYRMTGDNLREFHRQNRTQFGAEEMTLRELDKIRRFMKMEDPEKPPFMPQYGNLDVYLKMEWKNLEAKKKEARKNSLKNLKENSWRNLKKNSRRNLKEKAMTPTSDQPIRGPDFYPDVT